MAYNFRNKKRMTVGKIYCCMLESQQIIVVVTLNICISGTLHLRNHYLSLYIDKHMQACPRAMCSLASVRGSCPGLLTIVKVHLVIGLSSLICVLQVIETPKCQQHALECVVLIKKSFRRSNHF